MVSQSAVAQNNQLDAKASDFTVNHRVKPRNTHLRVAGDERCVGRRAQRHERAAAHRTARCAVPRTAAGGWLAAVGQLGVRPERAVLVAEEVAPLGKEWWWWGGGGSERGVGSEEE